MRDYRFPTVRIVVLLVHIDRRKYTDDYFPHISNIARFRWFHYTVIICLINEKNDACSRLNLRLVAGKWKISR